LFQQPMPFVMTQPLWGWDVKLIVPQGSATRATLGCGTESRWDSEKARPSRTDFVRQTLWVMGSLALARLSRVNPSRFSVNQRKIVS
jgi:hypothetical protein